MKFGRRLASLALMVVALGLMGQAQQCPLESIMTDLGKILQPGGGAGTKVYISNLSFMDDRTKTIMAAGDAEHINAEVERGMQQLAAQDPRYVINQPGNSLVNNDANAQKLAEIFWDPNLSKADKIDKFIAELMAPAKIDGLVSGTYTEQADGITVKPFAIARGSKSLASESRKFTKQEFECTDPLNANKKVLCQAAREDIKDTIIRLLKGHM